MILIILPIYNEENTIRETLDNLYNWCKENLPEFEILFINDHSKDNTQNIIESANYQRVKVFNNRFDNGKGSALKTGFILASIIYALNDSDIIFFIDGDGQIEPKEIRTFNKIMDHYDADVVIGNKRHAYSQTQYSLKRRLVSNVYNMIVRFLFGIELKDTQCGIKSFRRTALEAVISKVRNKNYAFDLELIVAINELQLRIADCPVRIKKQINAGSVSFKNILMTFIETIIIFIKKLRGDYAV